MPPSPPSLHLTSGGGIAVPGGGAIGVAIANLNGDGFTDLAMSSSRFDTNVYVLLGAGNGKFAKAMAYGLESSPGLIVIGDVNGDGVADLVTANSDSYGSISVLLGVGNGAFARSVTYTAGISVDSVAIGDLDGDGFMDLAYVGFAQGLSLVYALYGVGNGKFAKPVSYSTGLEFPPSSIATGDLNGDGIADVATVNNNVVIMLGERNRALSIAGLYPVGRGYTSDIAIGDLNGDGVLDIVTANEDDVSASVLLGVGNGTFRNAVSYPTGSQLCGWGPTAIAIGDINGDGLVDIAATSRVDDCVSVLVGVGKGVFSAPHAYGVGLNPHVTAIGDLNGDGVMDLVTSADDGLSILFGHRTA
jgi:FG-GAP-like repeat